MQIGDIIYLYTIDLLSVIAVKQELIPNRFCKVTEITPVRGGTSEHQYLKYKVTSLLGDEIYTINNYLSPYKYCSIEELETIIEDLKEDLIEKKYDNIKHLISEIKEIIR